MRIVRVTFENSTLIVQMSISTITITSVPPKGGEEKRRTVKTMGSPKTGCWYPLLVRSPLVESW